MSPQYSLFAENLSAYYSAWLIERHFQNSSLKCYYTPLSKSEQQSFTPTNYPEGVVLHLLDASIFEERIAIWGKKYKVFCTMSRGSSILSSVLSTYFKDLPQTNLTQKIAEIIYQRQEPNIIREHGLTFSLFNLLAALSESELEKKLI